MRLRSEILRCKKGIETVTAVFMLLLMFAVITGLIAAFFDYNHSAEAQMRIEQERSQEQITLTKQTTENNIVKYAIVNNTGTVEVKIRGVYSSIDGLTTFVCDPSTNPLVTQDAHMEPGKSIELNLQAFGIKPMATIVVATERGVRTLDNLQPLITPTPYPTPDTRKFVYGLLEITWEDFRYQACGTNNKVHINGIWDPGWVVPPKTKVAWRVTITNIGEKEIILNANSSFTTVPTGTPEHPSSISNLLSWYLYSEPVNQPQTAILPPDVPVLVYFAWTNPNGDTIESTYSQDCVAMAFLTFFGKFADNSPYAQTIPFEAAITIN